MDERIESILKNPWTIPVVVGVASFAGGFTAGFFLGRRRISEGEVVTTFRQMELDLDGEMIETSTEVVVVNLEDDPELAALLEEEMEIETQRERPDPRDIQVDQPVLEHIERIVADGGTPKYEDYMSHNVFATASSDDNWDYEEELKKRDPKEPYVIHKDEFWAEEMGYDQTSLVYYVTDDILVDQEDRPIPNYQEVIGWEMKFGHGSTDPNVFHVRSEENMSEYEILRDEGSYLVEVLGVDAEEDVDNEEFRHAHMGRYGKKDLEL